MFGAKLQVDVSAEPQIFIGHCRWKLVSFQQLNKQDFECDHCVTITCFNGGEILVIYVEKHEDLRIITDAVSLASRERQEAVWMSFFDVFR